MTTTEHIPRPAIATTTTEHKITGWAHLFAAGELDKWDFYSRIFAEQDAGRVTLTRITELVAPVVSANVVRMRRTDFLRMDTRTEDVHGEPKGAY